MVKLPESYQRISEKSFSSLQWTNSMPAFSSHFGNIHMLLLFLFISLLPLTLPSHPFLPQRWPSLFPEGPVTMICFLLLAWAAFPQTHLHFFFFSDGIAAASLRGVSHVRSWVDFIFLSTSLLPQRGLLQGEQCYFSATFALAASGEIINNKDLWASLAEKQTKMTASIRPATPLSHSAP